MQALTHWHTTYNSLYLDAIRLAILNAYYSAYLWSTAGDIKLYCDGCGKGQTQITCWLPTSNILTPMRTVATTTKALPRKSTKSPTELMATTRSALDDRCLKASCPPRQKLYPKSAANKSKKFYCTNDHTLIPTIRHMWNMSPNKSQ